MSVFPKYWVQVTGNEHIIGTPWISAIGSGARMRICVSKLECMKVKEERLNGSYISTFRWVFRITKIIVFQFALPSVDTYNQARRLFSPQLSGQLCPWWQYPYPIMIILWGKKLKSGGKCVGVPPPPPPQRLFQRWRSISGLAQQ